eukprot:gnl/TRDRNA2_/TRDRNA2_188458_c0_seq1.p1 gnl/TRDRNA2_/TRDRNA2_188458_c0~~gnl/TRDRNA2_/TRDRNA2_188458_c0_seq1.p1  ORF type:complete len:220 (+),score=59.56 gnl/TRDRNA2_/TRDRNA2_188458_c0_seq1:122-781(+)
MGACCSEVDKGAAQQQVSPNGAAMIQATPASGAAASPAKDEIAAPAGADADPFVSQVGELPTFSKPAKKGAGSGASDAGSEVPSMADGEVSDVIDGMSAKEQRAQAKAVIKDFVKTMVKGQKMNVMTHQGALKSCNVSLTRQLDAMKIKAGSQTREIKLTDISEIHAGAEVEGLDTPLDEMCATLMLASEDCITFRMQDINSRDTFVMCLLMFCNGQTQ